MGKVSKSISIDEELLTDVVAYCREHNMDRNDFFEQASREKLEREAKNT